MGGGSLLPPPLGFRRWLLGVRAQIDAAHNPVEGIRARVGSQLLRGLDKPLALNVLRLSGFVLGHPACLTHPALYSWPTNTTNRCKRSYHALPYPPNQTQSTCASRWRGPCNIHTRCYCIRVAAAAPDWRVPLPMNNPTRKQAGGLTCLGPATGLTPAVTELRKTTVGASHSCHLASKAEAARSGLGCCGGIGALAWTAGPMSSHLARFGRSGNCVHRRQV